MALTSRAFQTLFFLGCGYSILISDCLEINLINTLEDGVSFSLGSSAIFQCTINPYTGGQTWKVDSVLVADCGFVLCVENTSNPERYSFTPNVSTGSFIFAIDPVLYADDGNVIECLDGSYTINYTIVVVGPVNSTCDRNDFEICIYLAALGEFLHFIVSIQNIYQGFSLYSFQKRIGSNGCARFIWLNILAWIPALGSLVFKGILDCCDEGKCHDCEKQCPAQGYCYNCEAYLCLQCYEEHDTSYRHITRQIRQYQCHQCKIVCEPEDYCLNCEGYFCRVCLQNPDSSKRHRCPQLVKRQHKCHDCEKSTVAGHYCLNCEDHLCTKCFCKHYESDRHSQRRFRQGARKCIYCKEPSNVKGHCLTCRGFLCESCFDTHHSVDKHRKRKIHKEVNNIEKKYKGVLVAVCFPGVSAVLVPILWIKYWNKIRKQTRTFILLAAVGCFFAIAHPFVVLYACIATCKSDILHYWYIAVLAIKYIFFGWIPAAIFIAFIKLLEDSFYCDDCGSNSEVHGYCIECKEYLCGRCVGKHMHDLILTHSQKKDDDNYFETCKHSTDENLFYCTKCKRFMCVRCNKGDIAHRKNIIRDHDKKSGNTPTCQKHKCETICRDLISDENMCYQCYCEIRKERQKIIKHIKDISDRTQKCHDHPALADVQEQPTSVDAYCLTCKTYLCQECFEKHHKKFHQLDTKEDQTEDSQNTRGRRNIQENIPLEAHKGTHLFCNTCVRNDYNVKAEYYSVKLKCAVCAQCFLKQNENYRRHKGHTTEGSQNTTGRNNKISCEVHKAIGKLRDGVDFTPPENTTTSERVWCNVCKMVLCGTCFVDHFNVNRFLQYRHYDEIVRKKEMSDTSHKQTGRNDMGVYFSCDECKATKADMFCCYCKQHLCAKCKTEQNTHDMHNIVEQRSLHDPLFVKKDIVCKKCPEKERRPAECLHLGNRDFMCTSCFEKLSENNEGHSQPEQCKLCPDDKRRPINVYCLVCKETMCVACFKWHMRLKQSWQEPPLYTMLEGNDKNADSSPKKSVSRCVVVRIIAGPLLLLELILWFIGLCIKDCCTTIRCPKETTVSPEEEQGGTKNQNDPENIVQINQAHRENRPYSPSSKSTSEIKLDLQCSKRL